MAAALIPSSAPEKPGLNAAQPTLGSRQARCPACFRAEGNVSVSEELVFAEDFAPTICLDAAGNGNGNRDITTLLGTLTPVVSIHSYFDRLQLVVEEHLHPQAGTLEPRRDLAR